MTTTHVDIHPRPESSPAVRVSDYPARDGIDPYASLGISFNSPHGTAESSVTIYLDNVEEIRLIANSILLAIDSL